jgi:hypothetical protein
MSSIVSSGVTSILDTLPPVYILKELFIFMELAGFTTFLDVSAPARVVMGFEMRERSWFFMLQSS